MSLHHVITSGVKQSSGAWIAASLTLLAMTLAAGACSKPNDDAIAACEKFIQGSLRSPSTYAKVSSKVSDQPITAEDLALYQLPKGSSSGPASVRTVFIEYDAANAYGTPVRGTEKCDFLLVDAKNERYSSEPSTAATLASADRTLGKGDGCCLPPLTPEANEVFGNMTLEMPEDGGGL